MALVSKDLPGFYNGINQQPTSIRLDTQVEEQLNGYSSLVDGLVKRQNSEHLAVLTSTAKANSFVHTINRDETERYVVVFTDDNTNPLEIYTVTGVKCTLKYGLLDDNLVFTADDTVKNYLITTNPYKNIRCTTINDYTLVANRSIKCAMASDLSGGSITGRVQTFSRLPGTPSSGNIYEVRGDNTNNFDNYYTQYDGSVWKETVQPGLKYKLDAATMPHKIVRTANNEFTVARIVWDNRLVGDDNSCLIPSFIDGYINNIFFFKGRLGLISQDRVIMSRTNDFFNFWRGTVLDVLADDPIDIDVSSTLPNSVVDIKEYAPFNTNLILVSDGQQFSLGSGTDNLTPTSTACTPVTNYAYNNSSTICVAGTNVLFAGKSGASTTIREYFVQPDSLINEAADITAHVPNYIPDGDIQLESCAALDTVFCVSSGKTQSIYVYKYYWKGNEKPQSAWSEWMFSGDVLGLGVIDTDLYIVLKRGTSVCLERIQLKRMNTGTLGFRVHLDRQIQVTGTYDAITNYTTFNLPYSESGSILLCNSSSGQLLNNVEKVSNNSLRVKNNVSGNTFICGINYTFSFKLNEFYIKDANTKVPYLSFNALLRTITLGFSETGYFQVRITPKSRTPLIHTYTGVVLGSAKIGTPYIDSGSKRFIILGNSKDTDIEVINDTYLPCSFQTGTIEAVIAQRSKQI